jgi:hypothetical protein
MWQEILRDYDHRHCCDEEQEIAWFRDQPTLAAAIVSAARAVDRRGRRYSHQYRIRRAAIAHAVTALSATEGSIAKADSFDELLRLITRQLGALPGIGPLYRYNTAFRIGAYLGMLPTRVYLHAGTRSGARALNLDYQKEALEIDEVPVELRHRAPHEIEDILCIYKDRFQGGAVSEANCRPQRRIVRKLVC